MRFHAPILPQHHRKGKRLSQLQIQRLFVFAIPKLHKRSSPEPPGTQRLDKHESHGASTDKYHPVAWFDTSFFDGVNHACQRFDQRANLKPISSEVVKYPVRYE